MLKLVFWVLLLVNAVLLGLNFNFLGNWTGDSHNPARMQLQQHADQLKLMSVEQALAASEALKEDKASDARAEKISETSDEKQPLNQTKKR